LISKQNKSVANERILLIITFLSGFSFLIYEVSFNRYLSYVLGQTTVSSAIVLTAFMSGFGFGANFWSRKAEKSQNLRHLLAILLAGVSVFSLSNLLLTNILKQTFSELSFETANLFLYIVSFVQLLIPAFFMGGIIPVVSKLLIHKSENFSKILSTVYALETIGSVAGALLAGFIFLKYFGQTNTIILAAALNFIPAVLVIFFVKNISNSSKNLLHAKQESRISKNQIHEIGKTLLIITTSVFGFAMLGLETAWLRIFKTYFTNASYTFSIVTAFSILGIAIGSFLYTIRVKTKVFAPKTLINALVLFGISTILGLIILINLPEFIFMPLREESASPFVRLILIPILASLLVILPPAILSGFSFPLISKLSEHHFKNVGDNIGKLLFFNTLGSLIAPLTTLYILIPIFGTGKSIVFFVALVSIIVIFSSNQLKKIRLRTTFIVFTAGLVVFMFSKEIPFLPPSLSLENSEILSYEETLEGSIIISNDARKGVFGKSTFVNNSAVVGSNFDAVKAVKMIGHLPFFAGLQCENALVIGFGVGVTTSAIASHAEVKQIDCVELVPELTNYAGHYSDFNFGVQNDSRFNLIRGDGRHFLELTSNKYDLISCDPTHPVLGSGSLYTLEYFELCKKKLTESGMLSQYLPLHKIRHEDLMGILKTVHSVFPNTTVWLGQYHAIILSSKQESKIDFQTWAKLTESQAKDDFFYLNPFHIAANIVMDSEKLLALTNAYKINTDDKSYTEFFNFDSFSEKNLIQNLTFLNRNRCNYTQVFNNVTNKEIMDEFVAGNIKLTESLIFAIKKQPNFAKEKLYEAVEINPLDQEFPFLIKLYYGK